jgi:hypothetical protein
MGVLMQQKEPSAHAIDSALSDIRGFLMADGYDLGVERTADGVEIRVIASEAVCSDCLVPQPIFRDIVVTTLAKAGLDVDDLEIRYPN